MKLIPYRTGRYDWFFSYRWTDRFQNPPWFVPLWVLIHTRLFRPYRRKLDVSASKSKQGWYKKIQKNLKIISFCHHSHSPPRRRSLLCLQPLPFCQSQSPHLLQLLLPHLFTSLFFGFSSFERLVCLVLDARVPLSREYIEVIKKESKVIKIFKLISKHSRVLVLTFAHVYQTNKK